MASFMKMVNVNRGNGTTVDVAGKTRTRISVGEFTKCAIECNGDIRKMSDKIHLNQPAQAIVGRYENLIKKGVKLPPYSFVKLREHTEFTPQLWNKVKTLWNDSHGDAKYVAETIGVSVQTVTNWVKRVDKECFEKNIQYLQEKQKLSREEAIDLLEKQGGYVSITCEKKEGQRGRLASQFDSSIIEELNNTIAAELEAMENAQEEQSGTEKLIEEMVSEVEA